MNDFYKWDKALILNRLVSYETFKSAITTPIFKNGERSTYGFGWGIGKLESEPTASHAGRYGGFDTYIKRFLNTHTFIVFFTNNGFKNTVAIGNIIIKILSNWPYQIPASSIAEELYHTYDGAGIEAACNEYKRLKHDKEDYDFSESELNELGYQFLSLKKYKEALMILN